ncbi:MAG: aminotransferase class V-fold PLP-dependent enzyme [Acidobacteria bacterium]|nr:aminotransferase class V-fold PLP-dependent enzyme [Acidobacteriota bacterium]
MAQSNSPIRQASIYERLGLRPFINAGGSYTRYGGSLMAPQVIRAMEEASGQYVSIPELQEAAGQQIAAWLGAEGALVTCGCASALTLGTAACVTGCDEDKMSRLPDTRGMKNEVVLQKSHRVEYDHAVRNVGVRLIQVESRQELEAAIGPGTAMLFFLNMAQYRGQLQREEFVEIARNAGVPCLIDAAADIPPPENLTDLVALGFDLVAISGGKGIRGPQSSGLLLGRKDLIRAAFLNASPNPDRIGRVSKVGKEEIVGLWKALELYLKRDHQADWKQWERQLQVIAEAFRGIPGVKTTPFVPIISSQVPHLAVEWDDRILKFSKEDFLEGLRQGEPRIEVSPVPTEGNRLELSSWMLEAGEEVVVARRCKEVLEDLGGRCP